MPHSDEASIAVLKRDLEALTGQVAELTKQTKELVDAWNAAAKVIAFIKLLSTITASLGALWLVVRGIVSKPA